MSNYGGIKLSTYGTEIHWRDVPRIFKIQCSRFNAILERTSWEIYPANFLE